MDEDSNLEKAGMAGRKAGWQADRQAGMQASPSEMHNNKCMHEFNSHGKKATLVYVILDFPFMSRRKNMGRAGACLLVLSNCSPIIILRLATTS